MIETDQLKALVAAKYPADAYAILWELPDGTGTAASGRRADALVMSLWPSRGLTLHGLELKVSRTDWLKELKQPAKAEALCRFCDYWSVVVADKAIVKEGELPPTWGLMAPRGDGLATITPAPKLDAKPVDRPFLAACLRAGTKSAVAENKAALQKEYERGRTDAVARAEQHEQSLQKKAAELAAKIRDFEQAAGFQISTYSYPASEVGSIVRAVLAGKHNRDRDEMARIRSMAAAIISRIDGESA